MDDDDEQRRQEEEKELDRLFDLLKHISTLNVAALVLALALLRDFASSDIVPEAPLIWFAGSLLCSLGTLYFAPVSRPPCWTHMVLWQGLTLISYVTFFFGVLTTVFIIG